MSRMVTWLNDHLAVATGAAELARRTFSENHDQPYAPDLERLASDLDRERAAIREVLSTIGSAPSRVKESFGWLSEKVGRLKRNDQIRGYSPLSRLEEFEGLLLSVASLAMMWRTLERVRGSVGAVDPNDRAEALEGWLDQLRGVMAEVAEEALAPA